MYLSHFVDLVSTGPMDIVEIFQGQTGLRGSFRNSGLHALEHYVMLTAVFISMRKTHQTSESEGQVR